MAINLIHEGTGDMQSRFLVSSSFLFTLLTCNIAFSKIEIVLGNTPISENVNINIPLPSSQNTDEIIISKEQYILSYNKEHRAPNWVAWKLEADQIGQSGRSNNFSQDRELEDYLTKSYTNIHAVNPNEYKGSCYDRGHQIPSADRTDKIVNNQTTFLMSNMIPQTSYLNRVIWEHLEQYTRDQVVLQNKKAFIIAGPIYDENFGNIGPLKDIPVPSKNFKIIVLLDQNQEISQIDKNTQVISVIMPNRLSSGASPIEDPTQLCKSPFLGPMDKSDWMKYKASMADIQKLSGLSINLDRVQ